MPDLLIERHGRATVFTLNRPARHNALTGQIAAEFSQAVAEFDADPEQFVGIITGAGTRSFCSGADLGDLSATGEGISPILKEPDLFGIGKCDKPFIAAINGAAIGGGFELALLCDVRIASQNAWFSLPEINWGFMPGIAVNVLPRLLPIGVASDMLLFSERLEAEDAHRLGLLELLCPPGDVLKAALRKASLITASSQATVRSTKRMLRRHRDFRLTSLHDEYKREMVRLLATGDAAEGLRAFRERRAPSFTTPPGRPNRCDRLGLGQNMPNGRRS